MKTLLKYGREEALPLTPVIPRDMLYDKSTLTGNYSGSNTGWFPQETSTVGAVPGTRHVLRWGIHSYTRKQLRLNALYLPLNKITALSAHTGARKLRFGVFTRSSAWYKSSTDKGLLTGGSLIGGSGNGITMNEARAAANSAATTTFPGLRFQVSSGPIIIPPDTAWSICFAAECGYPNSSSPETLDSSFFAILQNGLPPNYQSLLASIAYTRPFHVIHSLYTGGIDNLNFETDTANSLTWTEQGALSDAQLSGTSCLAIPSYGTATGASGSSTFTCTSGGHSFRNGMLYADWLMELV